MHNCQNLAMIFIAFAALVNHSENAGSSASATTVTLMQDSTPNKTAHTFTFRKTDNSDNRVDFSFSHASFKEIDYEILQFIGDDISKVELSCQWANNKTGIIDWKYHGIEEAKVKRRKATGNENGYIIDLSMGPPVVRMECFSRENATVSNSTFIYTGENNSPYLYNHQKRISATVLNRTTVLLSCLLKYPLENDEDADGKELQLFKDGERVDNQSFCLSYNPELGYLLNLTKIENELGTYECRVTNSEDDVVYVELDKGDFISVAYKRSQSTFYTGQMQPFECKFPKDVFENEFKWSYLWRNGSFTLLNEKKLNGTSYQDASYYFQTIKVAFDNQEIAGITCIGKAKGSESLYNSSYLVDVTEARMPNILNAEPKDAIITYRKDLALKCFASGDPVSWKWLKNGNDLTDGEHSYEKRNQSTLTFTPAVDDTEINYTCVTSNHLGSASYNFRVKVEEAGITPLVITAVVCAVTLIWLGLLAIIFFVLKWRRRLLPPSILNWFKLGEALDETDNKLEPYASLKYDYNRDIKYKDLIFGRKCSSGNFGEVTFGWLKENSSSKVQTLTPVAIKTINYDYSVTQKENNEKFYRFLAEIKKMQYMGCHKFVVSYIGAVTADVAKYSAYLLTEYCSGGDLESYLENFNNNNGPFRFYDDIQGLNQGSRYYNGEFNQVVLKTSNLMQWAQFIAAGMEYLSSKGLLHMDLAARNVLLACPGINSDELELVNIDPSILVPKISDFGLSRYLTGLQNIYQPIDPNRTFPVRWLPLESLKELKFSTKSDVWALGITFWEMFTLAKDDPYEAEGMVQNCPNQLIRLLETGHLLERPEYAPEKMWSVMLECWETNPADRPDFKMIHDKIQYINEHNYPLLTSLLDHYSTIRHIENLACNPIEESVVENEDGEVNIEAHDAELVNAMQNSLPKIILSQPGPSATVGYSTIIRNDNQMDDTVLHIRDSVGSSEDKEVTGNKNETQWGHN
ncbi:unnamed protein product [Orchesella dallaii]|uniref:Receptor protein-tyrosine kinase n=1 Tax=Orchesella dallaii TaxID=48710 RepID=A0ABP1Q4R6_9HEXA